MAAHQRYRDVDDYGLRYLCQHLARVADYGYRDRLSALLLDPEFVERKCTSDLIDSLMDDYLATAHLYPDGPVSKLRRVVGQAVPTVADRPELAVQAIYNRLAWDQDADGVIRAALRNTRELLDQRTAWMCAEAPWPRGRSVLDHIYPLKIASLIQACCLNSPARPVIAIGSTQGDVVIQDLTTGKLKDRRRLDARGLTAIVLLENDALAYLSGDGELRTEAATHSLLCRPGGVDEERLLSLEWPCVIAVRQDNALVAWDQHSGETVVLADDVPAPLVALRASPDSRTVLFVAGQTNPVIGLCRTEDRAHWTTRQLPYQGPPVLCADVADHILLGTLDRRLSVIDCESGALISQIAYETHPEVSARGRPVQCSLGTDTSIGWAFIATQAGQILAWNWQENQLALTAEYRTQSETTRLVQLTGRHPSGRVFFTTERRGQFVVKEERSPSANHHSAQVSRCLITASQASVVSISELDRSTLWLSSPGLEPLARQVHEGITAAACYGLTDDIVVGNRQGLVWRQSRSPEPGSRRSAVLDEPVVSLFWVGDQMPLGGQDCVVVAGRSGRVRLVDLKTGATGQIWHAPGNRTQHMVWRTEGRGLYWSAYILHGSGSGDTVIALVSEVGEESICFRTPDLIRDMVIDPSSNLLGLVTSKAVQILRFDGQVWRVAFERDALAQRIAIVGAGEWLAVALADSPWLEVWRICDGMPTVTGIDIPGEVTCLTAAGDIVVVGLRSGELMSLRLRH